MGRSVRIDGLRLLLSPQCQGHYRMSFHGRAPMGKSQTIRSDDKRAQMRVKDLGLEGIGTPARERESGLDHASRMSTNGERYNRHNSMRLGSTITDDQSLLLSGTNQLYLHRFWVSVFPRILPRPLSNNLFTLLSKWYLHPSRPDPHAVTLGYDYR